MSVCKMTKILYGITHVSLSKRRCSFKCWECLSWAVCVFNNAWNFFLKKWEHQTEFTIRMVEMNKSNQSIFQCLGKSQCTLLLCRISRCKHVYSQRSTTTLTSGLCMGVYVVMASATGRAWSIYIYESEYLVKVWCHDCVHSDDVWCVSREQPIVKAHPHTPVRMQSQAHVQSVQYNLFL